MATTALVHDIGSFIKPVEGILPQATDGAADVNGAAYDRLGFNSGVIAASVGASTGAPTAVSVVFKLQESDDGSTGWTDVADASVTIDAENTIGDVNLKLAGTKQYVRVVATAALTGGTSPTLQIGASLVLGGAEEKPV